MSHARAHISVSRPPSREVGQRGGNRLRGDRISYEVSRSQAKLILGAAYFAYRRGLPFNRWITINLSKAGIVDELAAQSIRIFLKAAADAVKYWGGEFAATWVRENGVNANGDPTGTHVHILAHIPPHLVRQFIIAQVGWFSRVRLSDRHRKGTIDGYEIDGFETMIEGLPHDYACSLHKLVSYQLKSASQDTLAALHLGTPYQDGGMILGKRCGTSQNIGRAAWEKAKIAPPAFWLPSDLSVGSARVFV